MNAPPALYMMALIALMDQQGVTEFDFNIRKMDRESEQHRGTSVDFEVDTDGAVKVSYGRCTCAKCVAAVGAGTQ